SQTVSERSSVLACETTPIWRFTSAACRLTSRPETSARPPVGTTVVVSIPIVVDLPAPLGPSSPKNSPRRTSRSSPSTATSDPYTLRSCSVRIGASSIAENVSASLGLQCASPGGVPERPKGTGCKPVGSAYGGSNPPAPTPQCVAEHKLGAGLQSAFQP